MWELPEQPPRWGSQFLSPGFQFRGLGGATKWRRWGSGGAGEAINMASRADPMGTMRFTSMPASTYSASGSSFGSLSSSDDSDDDDCQVVGWRVSQRQRVSPAETNKLRRAFQSKMEPKGFASKMEFSRNRKRGCFSRDPELADDSQNDLRKQWEEATLRRRTNRAMQSEGSKAGTFGWRSQSARPGRETVSSAGQGSDQAISETAQSYGPAGQVGDTSCHDLTMSSSESTDSEVQITDVEYRGQGETTFAATASVSGDKEADSHAGSPKEAQFRSPSSPLSGRNKDAEVNPASDVQFKTSSGAREAVNGSHEPGKVHDFNLNQPEPRTCFANGASTSGKNDLVDIVEGTDQNIRNARCSDPNSEIAGTSDLAGDREKLKQTDDFKRADEEEWARRQQELEKQAEETRRLRKRRRAETDRKNEMENRQKMRLEEIRILQQKEERTMDMKEQIRGEIQANLERLALGCRDMASLLRRLQIPVEGGIFPSPQQVNAAYKKALLRFHPDRSSALAQGDPRRQVEAEETFKLISRMKTTLNPVAISMG